MNLYHQLAARHGAGRPVTAGLIGAGKFGTMFLAQARHTPGLQVLAIADLSRAAAAAACRRAGWSEEAFGAPDPAAARRSGATWLSDDPEALLACDGLEVVIEATGDPMAGIAHAGRAITQGRHVVIVNVEADVLAGPHLAREAARAGVVYSMAYGDQPALICELVDWARACGLTVLAAGKGTKYLPHYHSSTPETVWQHYGLTAEQAAAAGMRAKMFNSFLDGTKSAIEMAAVANATNLAVPKGGLAFPPAGANDLATVLRPSPEGALEGPGQVEVVSSLERDGRPVARDLRWGVFVVFEAPGDYTRRCFGEYGLVTDPGGRVSALYRPYHLIGLELNISVLSAALRGEPTGASRAFNGDVVAVAKRNIAVGECLDGEGGGLVWGRLMPAGDSLPGDSLPNGLGHGVAVTRAKAA
ncbi:MAG: NAD(P)H-dependent oxidoreductase, partial [Candidatus Competibacterales bacterium]